MRHIYLLQDRPFSRIMETARDCLKEALPIKCIEAVFLGTLLTAGWEGIQRLPLRFKSSVKSSGKDDDDDDGKKEDGSAKRGGEGATVKGGGAEVHRHIVLVIHQPAMQLWGALGISRREELMFKDLTFTSLSELVADYKAGYEKWGHELLKARIGQSSSLNATVSSLRVLFPVAFVPVNPDSCGCSLLSSHLRSSLRP